VAWWIDRTRRLRHHLSRLEVWELRRFGRSGLGLLTRQRVAVLTTTGRRSGQARSTPVSVLAYCDGYLIGGGAGGQTATPDWVLNLRATPTATLAFGDGDVRAMAVHEPEGADREEAYGHMAATFPAVRRYEEHSGRPLPLFVLRPAQNAEAPGR
jgi:deazaflavin-dependent oxidoreductase (nitroreductase family)